MGKESMSEQLEIYLALDGIAVRSIVLCDLDVAKSWQYENDRQNNSGILAALLGDGRTPGRPSKQDELVASTVIQWLGSTVGQCFLRDVMKKLPSE